MQGSGERAFAYAKACGIIGKSFVGKRAAALGNVSRLSELDRLIFPSSSRDLPEKELLKDLEKRIMGRAADSMKAVLNSFKNPPEFLVLLLRGWEYEDLKNILSSPAGEGEKAAFTDLGRFGTVNFVAWPDLDAMLKGTDFEFILEMKEKGGIFLQTELDRHYYGSLWKALRCLGKRDRVMSEMIVAEEISLRNVICALRLRTYYRLAADEVKTHLIDISTTRRGKKISLADDALESLDFPLDNRNAWAKWKRAEFLNAQTGIEWKADPRYFQNNASRYLYRMVRKTFRSRPSSLDTVFCFIKIKQFEEDALTSSAEGLGMGLTSRDVFSMLGVESV